MATSWRGAQPLAGQSVAPFGDMCDSPPLSLLHPLHSRVGRQAGRQTGNHKKCYLKQTHHHHLCTAVAIVEQPTRSCSTDREADGRTDRQANRETFVFGSQQQGRLRLKPCPGSCRAQLKAQHVAPKTPPGKGARLHLARSSWPFVVNYILFINQHTPTYTHTHAHSGICIRMCL